MLNGIRHIGYSFLGLRVYSSGIVDTVPYLLAIIVFLVLTMSQNEGTSTHGEADGPPEMSASAEPIMSAVGLKLPPFWPNDPTLWFAQVEAQFVTRGITTQQTKFAYVVSSLQSEVAQEVRDILLQPPAQDPFNKIKSELIRRTSASEQKRLHQLLISEELGDRKPSQLLRRMRQLLGANVLEESILKQLFLQRLPINAQLILASSSDSVDIDRLANIADKILEVTPFSPAPMVSTVTPPTAVSAIHTTSDMEELRNLVSKLSLQVDTLSKQVQKFTRQRSSSRDKSGGRRSRSSSSRPRQQEICWYHAKYGERALKCTLPCNYVNKVTVEQSNDQASN